jgi:hypothetical protein
VVLRPGAEERGVGPIAGGADGAGE